MSVVEMRQHQAANLRASGDRWTLPAVRRPVSALYRTRGNRHDIVAPHNVSFAGGQEATAPLRE